MHRSIEQLKLSSVHLTDQPFLRCRLTALQTHSDRTLARPAAYALFGGLAAYACYSNTPAALAEANVTVGASLSAVTLTFLSIQHVPM